MTRPAATVDPGINFGQPSVRGVAVDVLAGMVWAGDTIDHLAEDYNLTRAEVIVACWYMARYGTKTWRSRWKEWRTEAEMLLWRGDVDKVADPPGRSAT